MPGEGFFFLPNTRLMFAAEATFEPAEYALFTGLQIEAPALWLCGNTNDRITLQRCLISDTITFRGPVYLSQPCTVLGLMLAFPTARVEAIGCAFLGARSHLGATGGTLSFFYTTFSASVHAIELKNGAIGSFFGCSAIGNCLALSSIDGSRAIIESTYWCNNIYANLACYLSVITSERISVGLAIREAAHNHPVTVVSQQYDHLYGSYLSHIIVPNCLGIGNEIPCIIDNNIFTSVESNAVGELSVRHSMVLMLPNPQAPEPESMGCVGRSSLPSMGTSLAALGAASGFPGTNAVYGNGATNRASLDELYNAESQSGISPSLVATVVGTNRISVTGRETVGAISSEAQLNDIAINRLRIFALRRRI